MDAEVKAEELREDERILQAIDECLTSKDDLYERKKAILKEILEDVFTTIKARDRFFREQFQDFFFVEKYYKGPRVSEPEEFLVNIIKIPLNYNCIQLTEGNPGYHTLKLNANSKMYQPQWYKYSKFGSKWIMCRDYYQLGLQDLSIYNIKGNAFQQSIDSLLEWDMLNVPKFDNYTIKVRKNSFAFTQVCIKKQGYSEMNVNLVPVIEFDSQPPSDLAKTGFKWYAGPNPSKDVLDKFQWRIILCNHENDLLTRHSYLTPIIRLLDKLRDIQEWNVVPYYHIKTLFLHYARSMEDDSGLPDTFKLTGIKLLIHILDRLRNMCKTQHLEDAWFPQHNLVGADKSQFVNIVEQLTKMINEISDDPAKVADWIFTSEELSTYENELKAVGIIRNTDRPSNNLQLSENDEPGSAASGDIESSPSTEARNDNAACLEEMSRVIAGLKDSIDMLSRRLKGVEHKLQGVPNFTQKFA